MTASPDSIGDKHALRTSMRERLRALPPDAFVAAGAAIVDPLLALLSEQPAPVALFASRSREIDTSPLDAALRARHVVRAAPLIVGDALAFKLVPLAQPLHALTIDRLGIPTPDARWPEVDLARCLVVVPGLAFDERGGRMGYGRGYYDRALARASLDRCVGLCLDEQLVPLVPMEPHDVRLRALATPTRGVFRTLG
jgi:5-formyltetrahydrofolate cyclo-ligase